jgi:DNA-binding transcriptional regulator YhcF (GntR family)
MREDKIDLGAPPDDWVDPDGCGSHESRATWGLRCTVSGRLLPMPTGAYTPVVPGLKPLDRELGGLPESASVNWGRFVRVSRTVRRVWADLPATATVVWVYVAMRATYRPISYRAHALAAGEAFCPVIQIARDCGMTRLTVRRALATLEQKEWIARRSAGPDGTAIIGILHYAELVQADTDFVMLHHGWLRSCLWKLDPAIVKVALDHMLAVNFTVTRDDRPPHILDAGQALRSNSCICASCGISPSTVVRAHRELAGIGFIEPIVNTPGSRVASLVTVRWFKSSQVKTTNLKVAAIREEDEEAHMEAESFRATADLYARGILPAPEIARETGTAGGGGISGQPDDGAGTPSEKGSTDDHGGFDRCPPGGSINVHPGEGSMNDHQSIRPIGDSGSITDRKENSAKGPHDVRAAMRRPSFL